MTNIDYHLMPVTDFRSRAKETLEELDEHIVILTQRGRPSAVLMKYDAYHQLQSRLEELELELDSMLLEHARQTATEFISLDELFTDYETHTGVKLTEAGPDE